MSELSSVQTLTVQTTDFEQLQESASGWDQQYYKMSPGAFEGSMEIAQVGSTQVIREKWNQRLKYDGTAPEGTLAFALPINKPGVTNWLGMDVSLDTVIHQSPGKETELVSSEGWDVLILSAAEDDVAGIIAALKGKDSQSDRQHSAITLKPEDARALRRFGQAFLAETQAYVAGDEARIAQLSDQFVKLFLWELLKAQDCNEPVIRPLKSSCIVKRATEIVMADPYGKIGLTDICKELNLSLRNLHYAFEEVTDGSPATWLRGIRLNRAHKALLHADPEDVLVKQVALDNGFSHFGHFSKQYQGYFGRTPSQTLQAV